MATSQDEEPTKPAEDQADALLVEPVLEQSQAAYEQFDASLRKMQQAGAIAGSQQVQDAFRTLGDLAGIQATNRIVDAFAQQAAELSRQCLSAVRDAVQIQVAPMLAELAKSLRVTQEQVQSAMDAIAHTYLAPLKALGEQISLSLKPVLDQFGRTAAQLLEITLRRYHWWPVPGLPLSFYEGILDLQEAGQTRRVSRYICDWFRWNRYYRLTRMVARWDSNKYFRRRWAICLQAVRAHKRGWYDLTVPALMPLLEGIARDWLYEEKGVSERRGFEAIEKTLKHTVPADVYNEEQQQALVRYLTSTTFQDTTRVPPSGYELNRHGVAHSRHLHYGSEANSIRCFLLLETLYQYLSINPGAAWLPDPDDKNQVGVSRA